MRTTGYPTPQSFTEKLGLDPDDDAMGTETFERMVKSER